MIARTEIFLKMAREMALTGSSPATATAGPVTRCCRCNGAAKCLRCSCVRNNTPCSHCLPGDSGKCHNNLPRDVSPMALTGSSSAIPLPLALSLVAVAATALPSAWGAPASEITLLALTVYQEIRGSVITTCHVMSLQLPALVPPRLPVS